MLELSPETIDFVSGYLLPFGLVTIMFSLGLSLSILDITRSLVFPKAILIAVSAQVLLLPIIAVALAWAAQLGPVLTLSLIVIAACPGGITSNALTFYGRADVALSIMITALSTLITVVTGPLVISVALQYLDVVPDTHMPDLASLTGNLFLFSTIPVLVGMGFRISAPKKAATVLVLLRPAALGILLSIIAFSMAVNKQLVTSVFLDVAPIAIILNLAGMAVGLVLSRRFGLSSIQSVTVSVELGVQNVTMATFLGLSVLGRAELATIPTIYGVVMVANALIFLKVWQKFFQ
ncbi:bile acid:sodium symporter family protein [Kordiimonas pumila]|uniref:Bile acid:sodium symporter family protein n=1 Tax=Kordiimonas pumila TaxID=2161677 RepID=A0ABV7D363_9PROT|nr:hypothetical protein [Kordiimonas pumila]